MDVVYNVIVRGNSKHLKNGGKRYERIRKIQRRKRT